jgi:hypothetical protein
VIDNQIVGRGIKAKGRYGLKKLKERYIVGKK